MDLFLYRWGVFDYKALSKLNAVSSTSEFTVDLKGVNHDTDSSRVVIQSRDLVDLHFQSRSVTRSADSTPTFGALQQAQTADVST